MMFTELGSFIYGLRDLVSRIRPCTLSDSAEQPPPSSSLSVPTILISGRLPTTGNVIVEKTADNDTKQM